MPFFRFSGALRLCCACLALVCFLARPTRAAGAAPASVVIEACGAMVPGTGEAEVPRPARMVRPDGVVLPGDAGLGCRFTVRGGQRGNPVVVEARLSRPALAGQGQALDRWFVLARPGETAVAEHVFPEPGQALPGTWTLKLLVDGRLAAEKPFRVETARTNRTNAKPVAAAPPAAPEEVTVVPAPTLPPAPVPDLGTASAKAGHPGLPAEEPLPKAAAAPRIPQPAASTPTRRATVVPRSTPEKTPPRIAAASPKSSRTAGLAPSVKPSAPSRSAVTGYYALQTGVFAEPDNARGQAAKLRGRGFPACIAEENGPAGKRYRVLAGRFGDRRAAMLLRHEVATAAGGVKAVPQSVDPATAARLRCQ